jgi:hypothetical protein
MPNTLAKTREWVCQVSQAASPVARLSRISRGLSVAVAALLALLFVGMTLRAAGLDVDSFVVPLSDGEIWIPQVGLLMTPVVAMLALVLGLTGLARHEGRPAKQAAFAGAAALAASAIVFLWYFTG